MPLALPPFADLVTLGGLAASVLGGVITFAYGVRRHRKEDRRAEIGDTAAQVDQLRAQADKVFAYWTVADPAGESAEQVCMSVVHNGSDRPVFKAILTVRRKYDGQSLKRDWPALEEGERRQVPIEAPAGRQARADDHQVRLLFRDAADAFWLREDGRLGGLPSRLVLWAERRRADALARRIEHDFGDLYGIRVTTETGTVEELLTRFEELGTSSRAPDLLVGPHDWLGRLTGKGLLEEIVLTDGQRAAFEPAALAAMRVNGRSYGVPSVFDAVALVRNTDLAPDEPQTIEDLIATGRRLRARHGEGFRVLSLQVGPGGDAYHVWPLFAGAGGGLFERYPDGGWDPQRVRLGESVPAFEKLRALGERGERVLHPDLDREQAIEAFIQGRTAFLICASRALGDIAAANADRGPGRPPLSVAVSPVPAFAGRDRGPSLVSVYGFYVPVNGMNKALSRDLVGDYLAQPDVAASLAHAQRRPSAHVASSTEDPAVAAFAAECRRGHVMPAFPFIKEVWSAFGETERRVISGADPHRSTEALDRTVRRIVARRSS